MSLSFFCGNKAKVVQGRNCLLRELKVLVTKISHVTFTGRPYLLSILESYFLQAVQNEPANCVLQPCEQQRQETFAYSYSYYTLATSARL